MGTRLRSPVLSVATLALVLAVPSMAPAQLIPLKSVPLAAGDQFMIFPSQNLGMGGVSIALDDPWLDPFLNPAKGARTSEAQLFTSPTLYTISGDNGAARTLPLSMLFRAGAWFGGAALSLQQLESAGVPQFGSVFAPATTAQLLSAKSASNVYLFGSFGATLPGTGVSLAGSVWWADLRAVDGVDLLYPGSQNIEQFGDLLDMRIGFLEELEGGGSFEALLLHNRLDMTHDVSYVDLMPMEGSRDLVRVTRVVRNHDRTNTWGLHLGYARPLARTGWRVGGILTANFKSHPKIPNYELMNIPRDPGNSWAYNLGVGASRSEGPRTIGFDVIYEPIWSHTWAEAERSMRMADGRILPAGKKTVENDFKFSNALIRMGVRHEVERGGFQFGLQVRSIRYTLEQRDNVRGSTRKQREAWLEWTPTWGAILNLSDLALRYTGWLTRGSGRPGIAFDRDARERGFSPLNSDFIVAPEGPLTLQEAAVVTHQLSVSIPLQP